MNVVAAAMQEIQSMTNSVKIADAASEKLRKCAIEIHRREGRVLEDLFAIGAELLKARNILHGTYKQSYVDGHWLAWLRDDLKMSDDQAGRFIHVYEKYGVRGAANPHLSFYLLAELAAPNADKKTVKAIETHIAEGGSVTTRQVIEMKRQAKAGNPVKSAADVRERIAKPKKEKPVPAKPKADKGKPLTSDQMRARLSGGKAKEQKHNAKDDLADLKGVWNAACQLAREQFREWIKEQA